MCFVYRKTKTIFIGPSNDAVYSQLKLSFYVTHVLSLTKYVQVVNIMSTMDSSRQLIQNVIYLK